MSAQVLYTQRTGQPASGRRPLDLSSYDCSRKLIGGQPARDCGLSFQEAVGKENLNLKTLPLVSMSVTSGIVAALSAPLFEAVGFLEFERHWRDGRGSAFSLNLFKCNVSSLGFLIMVWLERVGNMGDQPGPNPFNALYLEHEPPNVYGNIERQRGPFLRKIQETLSQKPHDFVPILLDLRQQQSIEREDHQPYGPQNSEQRFSVQNVPEQEDWGETASQNIHPKPFNPLIMQPNFGTNRPPSEQRYSVDNKNLQQYVPGLQIPPVVDPFQDYVSQQSLNRGQTQPIFDQPNQLKPIINMEQGTFQQKGRMVDPTPLTQWFQLSTQPNDDAITVITVAHLMLSSLLGIFIGDCCELEALRLIGARRVLLMASMKPFAAAFFAHWFLHEDLHAAAWFGMALTIMGVLLVVQQSMESLSCKPKKQDEDGRVKQIRQSPAHISFMSSRTRSKKRSSGEKIANIPNATEKTDEINDDEMGFSTIWETNGFSYISSKPFRHKSLSKFDALYEISSDEESPDSVVEDQMFGLYDDFDEEVDELFSGGPLIELAHIKPLQSTQVRSNSATSLGSFGSLKKFVAVEDIMLDDSTSKLLLDGDESKNAAGDESNNCLDNAEVSKSRTADNAEPFASDVIISNPESQRIESLFLSPEEIVEENNKEFQGGYHSDDESNEGKNPKGSRRRLRSSISFGSVKSFNSECGPPPGSKRENSQARLQRIRQGYLLALCNVCLDSYGFVLTKQYGVNMTTWEINFIRYGFAGFILLLVSFFLRARDLFCTVSNHRAIAAKRRVDTNINLRESSPTKSYGKVGSIKPEPSWYRLPNLSWHSWSVMLVGVLFVSFLCPALQGYALFRLAFSLAMTLNSLTPLYAIPLMWLFKNQKPSKRGCWGAVIAVTGVMVLCIYDWM